MNPTKDNQLSLTAFAEAIHAEEVASSADVEAALETLTREAREQDADATRADIERQVADALAHDPQGEFAAHFLEVLQAERDLAGGWAREPLPAAAIADQQEAVIDQAAEPDLDLEDGPDFDDGPSYG